MSDLRRFVNDPEKVVEDELNGYLLVHGDQVQAIREKCSCSRESPKKSSS